MAVSFEGARGGSIEGVPLGEFGVLCDAADMCRGRSIRPIACVVEEQS